MHFHREATVHRGQLLLNGQPLQIQFAAPTPQSEHVPWTPVTAEMDPSVAQAIRAENASRCMFVGNVDRELSAERLSKEMSEMFGKAITLRGTSLI
jgi:hypothetical protein